uniref:Uncharacterized protein n=1 Tax=Tanacetum cinerariifolium TaxID=118510 RepID=A0A6L2NIN5_TANCI|nr:hypothetical protein [Tanacetum cinerariifolium]
MPQPMQNLEDNSDPTTAMNKALDLIAKAFKINTIPTNNNQRSSLIPCNSQIAQPDMNTSQDIKMKMVDDNVRNQMRQNAVQNDWNEVGQNAVQNLGIQIIENLKGLSVVSEIANQYGNRNVETAPTECNVKPRKWDAAYLQQRLQIALEEEAGIQSTQEEFKFMAAADAYEETEIVKANYGSTEQLILGKPPSSSYKPKLYSFTPFLKSLVLPKVDKMNALSNPVTSNSAPFTRESKVMQTVNVIASRIFRTNPSKTSRVDNVVPNKPVKTSIRTKPITISQLNVIHKQQANSDSKGFSSTRVNNTYKTRRPHPRINSNINRVQSKSKSSYLSNNVEKIEENHMNSQIPKNQKHMSSECSNITLVIRNAKSKIVCVMCKQCLVTANHDVCVLNYVNDMDSRADNQSANVSICENQKKHKANAKKLKELGSKGSLASSRHSKPRTCLRWIPIGRISAMCGKLTHYYKKGHRN